MKALLGPLLLALGVAAGYGVGQIQSNETPPPSSSELSPSTEESPPSGSGHTPKESVDPRDGEANEDGRIVPSSAPTTRVPERELVRALLERAAAPVVSASADMISGYVFDDRHLPVEGVKITAKVLGSLPGRPVVDLHEAEREEYAAYVVAQHRFQTESTLTTFTDSEGRYELTGLFEINYRLSASKDGFKFERRGSGWNARPGDAVDFLASETVDVEFALRLPDGTSPDEAKVSFRSGGMRSSRTYGESWSREKPWCSITRGSYEVTAEVDEDFRSEPIRLDLSSTAPSGPVTLELVGRRGIRGEVICEDAAFLDQVRIRYLRLAPGAEPDLKMLAAAGERTRLRDERFAILDLDDGSYVVGVQFGEDRIAGSMVVEVAGGITEQDLTVVPLTKDEVIVGWVRDETGQPLEGVRFSLRMEGPTGSRSTGSRAIPREDGSFWLIPDEAFWAGLDDPNTTVSVEIRHRELGTKKVELTSNEFTADFRPPAFLTMTVGNYLGTASEGLVDLALQREADADSWMGPSRDNKIDSDGLASFGPVEPGAYVLSVSVKLTPDAWSGTNIASVPIDLVSGENTFTYSIPPMRSVEVRFPAVEGKASIQFVAVNSSGFGGRPHSVSAEEPFVIPAIPEGEYVIMLMGREMTMMKLTVVGNVSTEYAPAPLNAMKVQNASHSGLDELGFESGDLIVGIDGQSFESGMALQMALMAGINRPKVTLMIKREGVKRDLEVDGPALQKAGRGGGVIPWSQELE